VTTKCAHTTPMFGCDGCISTQRDGWAAAQYKKFCAAYNAVGAAKHYCPDHRNVAMHPYCWIDHEGKLKAILSCGHITSSGEFLCEDNDVLVDIEKL
jgi:hypothetical protein